MTCVRVNSRVRRVDEIASKCGLQPALCRYFAERKLTTPRGCRQLSLVGGGNRPDIAPASDGPPTGSAANELPTASPRREPNDAAGERAGFVGLSTFGDEKCPLPNTTPCASSAFVILSGVEERCAAVHIEPVVAMPRSVQKLTLLATAGSFWAKFIRSARRDSPCASETSETTGLARQIAACAVNGSVQFVPPGLAPVRESSVRRYGEARGHAARFTLRAHNASEHEKQMTGDSEYRAEGLLTFPQTDLSREPSK